MSQDQLDVFRDSAMACADAYRKAAETARLNPFESYEKREARARYYEAEAEKLERTPA